jgi:hypothetical protein
MASAPQLPTCETRDDLVRHDGRRARVVGEYVAVPASKRPADDDPPTSAVVRLRDGTSVLLEPSWSPAGARSEAELATHAGRRVVVTGVVHERSPAPAQSIAFIIGPCISPVESIELYPSANQP